MSRTRATSRLLPGLLLSVLVLAGCAPATEKAQEAVSAGERAAVRVELEAALRQVELAQGAFLTETGEYSKDAPKLAESGSLPSSITLEILSVGTAPDRYCARVRSSTPPAVLFSDTGLISETPCS